MRRVNFFKMITEVSIHFVLLSCPKFLIGHPFLLYKPSGFPLPKAPTSGQHTAGMTAVLLK